MDQYFLSMIWAEYNLWEKLYFTFTQEQDEDCSYKIDY